MMEVTEAARKQLHNSLLARDSINRQGKCFRIMPKDDRSLTLKFAKPDPSDSTFEHDGHVVLAVPRALETFLSDKSVDIDHSGNLKITTSH